MNSSPTSLVRNTAPARQYGCVWPARLSLCSACSPPFPLTQPIDLQPSLPLSQNPFHYGTACPFPIPKRTFNNNHRHIIPYRAKPFMPRTVCVGRSVAVHERLRISGLDDIEHHRNSLEHFIGFADFVVLDSRISLSFYAEVRTCCTHNSSS